MHTFKQCKFLLGLLINKINAIMYLIASKYTFFSSIFEYLHGIKLINCLYKL
jgi:hypothetical protein